MQKSYVEFIQRKQDEFGKKFDYSDLAKNFIPFYENGRRVEVQFKSGEIKRGTIGITTGWKPVFLLMLRKNSIGSSYTLCDNDKITKVLN
jgi:hypothetical protein